MRRGRAARLLPLLLLPLLLVACGRAPSPEPPSTAEPALAAAESTYADARALADRADVLQARGLDRAEDGTPVDSLLARTARGRAEALAHLDRAGSSGASRVRDVLRAAVLRLPEGPPAAPGAPAATGDDGCRYDAATLAQGPEGRARLTARIYACYGRAARRIVVDGDTLDRLTVLGRLGREPDAATRRALFHALAPVWRSVNADGAPTSPYRTLLPLSAAHWRATGAPPAEGARALGIPPDSVEPWLVRLLERWRDRTPATLLEPWDWWYDAGRPSRVLGARLPLERLREINDRYYASLGADPVALGVRYDLAPREGKTPVAFATFGRRARLTSGGWTPTEPWVFATYRTGGLDNLNELLHETGHAVHIAAIRTRPAFLDWPDSDPLSEALGDWLALEAYEPAWQQRWLGDSVPTADALRARYASVMMDVAWALLELRLHRDPRADPNTVWTAITREYLRIAPHPELSWWAMRGQLVDVPGYMSNYAIGAIVIADVRAQTIRVRGPLTGDDPGWYAWASERLYRFGLERTSRDVVERFLGRPVSPVSLLAELDRMD